jgi:hypothetical protein
MNNFLKFIIMVSGVCMIIGILIIAIFVAGAILGFVLSVLVPIGLFFTGIGLIWFLATDFSPEKPDAKQ